MNSYLKALQGMAKKISWRQPAETIGISGNKGSLIELPVVFRAGFAIFNWNFDAHGKLLGTTFQGMIAPPLQ